jgi:hypothetical protein
MNWIINFLNWLSKQNESLSITSDQAQKEFGTDN